MRLEHPVRSRAARSLNEAVEEFGRLGYRQGRRSEPLSARLSAPPGSGPLRLELVPQGRVFGGNYGLEVSLAEPALPRTRGLSARGRGVVRMQGVSFRARRGDEPGRRLAAELGADARLREALTRVHFERIRVEPDGRPVIRHMGGSLVWILFPPIVKGIPLVAEQARATVAALEAFAGHATGSP